MNTLCTIKITQRINNFERSINWFLKGKGFGSSVGGLNKLPFCLAYAFDLPFPHLAENTQPLFAVNCGLCRRTESISRPVYFFLLYMRFS